MSGFTSPNHTNTPNDLFDVHMLDMGECELKVTLVIIRKILGYHKKSDPISLTQLQKLTGLSRQGASDGVNAAIKRGLVEVIGTGKRGVIIYGLVINSDQSTEETTSGQQNRPETSQKSRHTKENKTKENLQKKEDIAPSGAVRPIFEAVGKHAFGITDFKGISKASRGRIGSLETLARQLVTARQPAATDEQVAIQVTKFASAETFKAGIQGTTGFELKFAAYLEQPAAPINPAHVPYVPPPDNGAVEMPPEAAAAFAALKAKLQVNDQERQENDQQIPA